MIHTQAQLSALTFLAFDTETTDLFSITHRLVEVGSIRFRLDGRKLATLQTLIDPELPIPPDIQRVHQITDTMVRGKPTIRQIMSQFIAVLGESDSVLLAHHALFDVDFLAMALTRLGIVFPLHDLFDNLDMTRRLYPAWPHPSSENVSSQAKSR